MEDHKLDDASEATLIRILHKMLPTDVTMQIERCSSASNIKWSDVVEIALTVTDWETITETLNRADEMEAIGEAEDILRSN